jgi:hypothetical protein
MTDEQILQQLHELVEQVERTSQSWHGRKVSGRDREAAELPEYYPGYRARVQLRDRIRTHAELDHFPEHLFRKRAPRQTEEELDYLRGNYKQTTLPVYLDLLSTVGRIYHDANWSLTVRDRVDVPVGAGLVDYLETFPSYGSYEQFFKAFLPHLVLVDANGLIGYAPRQVPTVEVDNGDGTTSRVISGDLLEPVPTFHRCDQIVAEKPDDYYLVELDQPAEVRYYNTKRACGRSFLYYDREVIARAVQVGDYTAHEYAYEIVYRHDWGRVPARKAGGIPQLRGGVVSYLSPFSYAVDVLDVALLNEQYLNAIVSACVYPHRVMYGDPCEFEYRENGSQSVCDGGKVYDTGLQTWKACPSCNGTGLRSRLSPLGVLLVKPPSNTSQGDAALPGEPLKFVAPDTEAPRFILEKIARDEQKARRILHLHTSADTAPGGTDPLATGMLLDNKALAAFVKPISDNLFAHVEFGANAMGYLRYGENAPTVSVVYPVTFDFNTEADYLGQLAAATKAGLPPFLVQTVLYRYLQSLYYNDAETSAVFETIVQADRLLPFTPTDVAMLQARDLATKWEVTLHDSALTLVEELRQQYTANGEDFLDLPIVERVRLLREHAQARTPGAVPEPVAPTIAPTAIPAEGVANAEQAVAAVLAASAPTS